MDTCCPIMQIEYQDKADRKGLAEMEDHKKTSLGPSWTTRNVNGLEAQAHGLKHLQSSVKGLLEAPVPGYKVAVRVACLDVLRNLKDFRVTLKRVAVAG